MGDLVSALVNSLERIDLVDATIEIGGAEYVSYNDDHTVMRVSGTHRVIVPVPPYLLRTLNRMVTRVVRRWPMTRSG